jgi:hypothetical protein
VRLSGPDDREWCGVGNVWAGAQNYRVNEMTVNPFVFYNLPGGW